MSPLLFIAFMEELTQTIGMDIPWELILADDNVFISEYEELV